MLSKYLILASRSGCLSKGDLSLSRAAVISRFSGSMSAEVSLGLIFAPASIADLQAIRLFLAVDPPGNRHLA
jgi:hypothetical protein